MKSFTPLYGFLLAGLLLANVSAMAGGQETGNGGYFCQDGATETVPCDLYFQARNFELPYRDEQRVEFSELPHEVLEELLKLNGFLSNRSFKTVNVIEKLSARVQIYNTKTFMGEDLEGLPLDKNPRQVGYRYRFTRINPEDKSHFEIVYVIELDLDYLSTRPARHQALALMHEFLHFLPGVDHSVILPLIQALDKVSELHQEQRRGERRVLTEDEYQASRDIQAYLVHLGMPKEYYQRTIVHRKGGGVVHFRDKQVEVSDTNFIDVKSVVRNVEPGQAYYWRNAVVTDAFTDLKNPGTYKVFQEKEFSLGMRRVENENGKSFEIIGKVKAAPIRKCIGYDARGRCTQMHYWLPFDIRVAAGEKTYIERFAVSLYKYGGGVTDRNASGARCSFSLVRLRYERMRHDLGSTFRTSFTDAECEVAVDLIKSGNLTLYGGAGFEGGPLMLFGLGRHFDGENPDSEKLGRGLWVFSGNARAGVRVAKRLSVAGTMNWDLIVGFKEDGDATAHDYERLSRGIVARWDVSPNLFVEAEYRREKGELSNNKIGEDASSDLYYEKFFGISVGGRHDIFGPYSRK